jgi:hypothetical protein
VGHPGETYDPFSHVPETLLGSGGGAGCFKSKDGSVGYAPGGDGGGAIIIRVYNLRLDGQIYVNGGGDWSACGSGSGGLVLIVADHIEGNGNIHACGGAYGSRGGDGRIIIRSPDAHTSTIFNTGQIDCYPAAKIEKNLDFPDLSSLRL